MKQAGAMLWLKPFTVVQKNSECPSAVQSISRSSTSDASAIAPHNPSASATLLHLFLGHRARETKFLTH